MPPFYVIGHSDVRANLSMSCAIDLVRSALVATSRGATVQPLRRLMPLSGDANRCLGLMPGQLESPDCFGCKITSVFPDNFRSGRPSHQGGILLFEAETGAPVALVHGGEVTAIRTAAASAVATEALARRDAAALAVLGYGRQASEHIAAMQHVRDIAEVRVWGRRMKQAREFAQRESAAREVRVTAAESVADAIRDADIVCTTTASGVPVLAGESVPEGCHLNVVGSSEKTSREIDSAAVARSRYYVDSIAMAREEAGELLHAVGERAVAVDHIVGEIGQLLSGDLPGRQSGREITVFKSLGNAAEDLYCAHFLYGLAKKGCCGRKTAFSA